MSAPALRHMTEAEIEALRECIGEVVYEEMSECLFDTAWTRTIPWRDLGAFALLLAFLFALVLLAAGCVEPAFAQTVERDTVGVPDPTCVTTRPWRDPVLVNPVTGRPLVWLATYHKPGTGPCKDRPDIAFVPGVLSSARVGWEVE